MSKLKSPRSLALMAGLLLAAGLAAAQGYPAKPLNLMVPYPAGGPSDAIARIFNNQLGKELGQQVLVENLGGVSGALAAQKVLASEGYKEASIRGITPASDPDANSLGGERDAAIMIANAENHGTVINSLGTPANEKATEGLGKGDVSELKD